MTAYLIASLIASVAYLALGIHYRNMKEQAKALVPVKVKKHPLER